MLQRSQQQRCRCDLGLVRESTDCLKVEKVVRDDLPLVAAEDAAEWTICVRCRCNGNLKQESIWAKKKKRKSSYPGNSKVSASVDCVKLLSL
jgi:hypothetical protein